MTIRIAVAVLVMSAAPAAAEPGRALTLADAVAIAVANDADLYIAREDALIAGDGVALARSVFAPRLFGEIRQTRDDAPPSATSFGGTDVVTAAELGWWGRVARTGLTYTIAAGVGRVRRDDPFSTVYDPALTATVRGEVVQPLARGAFGAARRPIEVAALRRDQSEQELRAQLERRVGAVEVAYWNLVRARSERDARTSAVKLAKEQVDESKRIARIGTGTELDIVEAETSASRVQQELLRSEQEVIAAEGVLIEAMGVRAGDPGWDAARGVVPTDATGTAAKAPDVEAQLAIARGKRADALAAKQQVDAEQAALAVTADQRRMSVDLFAGAASVGFAGTFADNYATSGVNGLELDPPFMTDPAYDGGLGRAARNAATARDLRLYIGLRFEIPVGDHEADARHAIQQRTVTRARLVERDTLARIETEVRTAVARVALDLRIVEASDRTVALSEKLLDGMRKRFRNGASTSFDVLRVAEELTRARIEAARARASYRAGVTRLALATGTLLDGLGITVKTLGQTPR
jgi:outer membrane protein TolC